MVYLLKPIEIDGLASLNMVIFHGYVTNNQRVGYSKSDLLWEWWATGFGDNKKMQKRLRKRTFWCHQMWLKKYPITGDFHGKIMCTVKRWMFMDFHCHVWLPGCRKLRFRTPNKKSTTPSSNSSMTPGTPIHCLVLLFDVSHHLSSARNCGLECVEYGRNHEHDEHSGFA